MDIPIFIVDAFARVPFEGNPAAICLVGPEQVLFFAFRLFQSFHFNLQNQKINKILS